MDHGEENFNQKTYKDMIGSLLYLTVTRPNIMFNAGLCARFQFNTKQSHLKAIKRIFRYLKGTPNLGLQYPKFKLIAYANADFTSCQIDRKNTFVT